MARRLRAPAWWAIGLTTLFVAGSVLPSVTFFSNPDHYLPLHITLEFISISISFMVLALAWNLRHIEANSQIIVLGVFSFAILLIDLAHTLSFAGMPDLATPSSSEKAIFFWLSGRLIAAVGLLIVAILPIRHWRVRTWIPLLAAAVLVTAVVWWAGLAHLDSLPHTFVSGQGLTPFKVDTEYVIAAMYAVAAVLLMLRARHQHGMDNSWLATAAWTLALAEMLFTFYTNVTDIFNVLGHVYKAIAYFMVYKAIFATGVQQPYRQLAREQSRLRSLIDSVPDLVSFKDQDGRYVGANRAFAQYVGHAEEELVGLDAAELGRPADAAQAWRKATGVRTGTTERFEEWIPNSAGGGALFDTVETQYFSPDGQALGVIEVSRDITEQRLAEERIHQLAMYDQLTGLPNRLMLRERATKALAESGRSALLVIDLDDFRTTNDTLGHRIGDLILQEAGRRVYAMARETDIPARLGGDEFALLLLEADPVTAADVAQRLMHSFSAPFMVEQYELTVTPSIGIAMSPIDGTEFEALATGADAAMFRTKQEGRNAFRFHTPDIRTHSADRLELITALRRATDREEFVLHYQPQVRIADGRIIGAEALVRWNHPTLGLLQPGSFIELAEDSGLILPIGDWVLRRSLTDGAHWIDRDGSALMVAVNISAVQFLQNDLPVRVATILDETGFPGNRLELEITESVAMRNADTAAIMLNRLHDLGVSISIDDFGTGYSSMAYLKRFRVDRVKIDKSFVKDLSVDADADAIVLAIIQMATSLRCTTVAEGVENDAQRDYLLRTGCDATQGYGFSRPLPQDEFLALLREQSPVPAL
jgi:diguanylate cyclase (GGDEF)-like protein/PAS domain S-box-containing protein